MEFQNYVFKKGNKFPHIVHVRHILGAPKSPGISDFKKWLIENYGTYGSEWFRPSPGFTHQNFTRFYVYAFKNLESAMAFKLVWM